MVKLLVVINIQGRWFRFRLLVVINLRGRCIRFRLIGRGSVKGRFRSWFWRRWYTSSLLQLWVDGRRHQRWNCWLPPYMSSPQRGFLFGRRSCTRPHPHRNSRVGSIICLSAGVRAEDVEGTSSGLTYVSANKKERITSCSINQPINSRHYQK